jgi:hypothetical protein
LIVAKDRKITATNAVAVSAFKVQNKLKAWQLKKRVITLKGDSLF